MSPKLTAFLFITGSALFLQACTVRYTTDHPMANNPRYKDQYARIAPTRRHVTEIVVQNPHSRGYSPQTALNRQKQVAIDPNSPKALTFGARQSIFEQAEAKGYTGLGGLFFGKVVVIPQKHIWEKAVVHGGMALEVKPIHKGDTIQRAQARRSAVTIPLRKGVIPSGTAYLSREQGMCHVVLDNWGNPLVLREDETGFDSYGFSHFVNDEASVFSALEAEVKRWQEAVKKGEAKISVLKNRLSKNRAYQNGQCVSVKQRAIPPAPKRTDPKLIALNAHGACVNLVGSQFTQEQVIEALESAGRWDITRDYQQWALGDQKMSCASGITIPESDSLVTRAIDWFAPNLGKDYFRKAMRKDIDVCIYKVKRACDGGYERWLREKSKIINEPATLLKQCQADTASLNGADKRALASAKAKLATARQKLDEARKTQITKTSFIPFTDKRTYCEQ